jgi:type II secretory pathway component PulF
LLKAERNVPDSLDFIVESGVFPQIVLRRIAEAREDVVEGQPLDEALTNAELLPPSMGPLIRSAQTSNTLAWALEELGDHLGGRAVRLVRRISLIVSPLIILALGALVAFIALGMFMPLVQLIERLAE